MFQHIIFDVISSAGLSALAIVTLTLVSFVGIINQNKNIWREQSVESLSAYLFIFNAGIYVAGLIYGIIHSDAIIFINGLLVLPYIPILFALHKLRGFRRQDTALLVAISTLLIAMSVTPYTNILYMFLIFVGYYGIIRQFSLMYRSGSRGVVSFIFLSTSTCSAFFWTSYALKIDDPVLQITSPLSLICYGSTLILWTLYWKRDRQIIFQSVKT